MAERRFQVFGLGQCCIDYLAAVHDYPESDSKCEFKDMVVQGGGPVATALAALARWGVSCTFTGILGDDAFGPMIKQSLDDEGIDTSGIIIRKNAESQFAFVTAVIDSGKRTIFWRKPTGQPLKPDEVDSGLLKRSRILHTDGIFPEASLSACKHARNAGVRVVVDAGSLREGLIDIARHTDYFIASAAFAEAYTGKNDPEEACYRLAELGPRLVGITLGPEGYVALFDRKLTKRPAYTVEAVDTTGCGDIYHAGFIYGILKGWTEENALDFGSWAASRTALKLGGRSGIPAVEDWKPFSNID